MGSSLSSELRLRRLFWVAVAAAIALGVWLRAPAFHAGYHTDDAVQVSMVRGDFAVHRSIFDLFRFADGERDGLKMIESGYHPWWTQPNLRIAMFRPLASALIAVDYWCFGANAFYSHVHSMLWWAVMVVVAALVLSRVLALPTAAIAIILFCIHPSHSVPVAWLANRSTLIATTFGLLGLWIHLLHRERPSRRLLVFEYCAFILSLLGGEYALPALAYVLAVELVDGKLSWPGRLRALLPALGPLAVIAVLRPLLHFGIRGSGYYVSPIETPRAYVRGALERIPVLVADLVAQVPAVWWVFGSPYYDFLTTQKYLLWGGIGTIALLALAVYILTRVDPKRTDQYTWLGLGALLSAIPGATALPENRVLVAASFGTAAIFASLFVACFTLLYRSVKTRRYYFAPLPIALAGVLVYFHAYRAWVRADEQLHGFIGGALTQRAWALNAQIPDKGAENRRVIIVTGADFTTIANLPWVRSLYGRPLVKSYWRLSGALQVHEIARVSPNVIELSVLSNEVENTMVGSLYRSSTRGYHRGDKFEMDGMKIEVLAVEGKTPWLTRITFERSLDDPQYLFLHSMEEGIKAIKFPPVGGKLRLPAPARPHF